MAALAPRLLRNLCALGALPAVAAAGPSAISFGADPPRNVCPAPIPQDTCEAGNWPLADANINGEWWPSRSTHYGSTSGGACGFDGQADGFLGGLYTAPQGNYYAQQGSFPSEYLSCGECFEVRCVDPHCTNFDPVTIVVADACPCFCNTKWCCERFSGCTELGPDKDGSPHCAASPNGTWSNVSLHLDLADVAFNMIAHGASSGDMSFGVMNTMARRVSCKPQGSGNILLQLSPSASVSRGCFTVYPEAPRDCFYYLAFSVMNAAHLGAVPRVELQATVIENNTLVSKWVALRRDINSPPDSPQEQYGKFVTPQNLALFFPLTFRLTNRLGESVTSRVFQSADEWQPNGTFIDTGVNFKLPPSQATKSAVVQPSAGAERTIVF